MEPGLWAKFASAITNFARRIGNPYLRPTDAPGPLPTDGTNRHRPYILPMPMPGPPEPAPGPVTPPAPVVVLGPQPADRAALIAATTYRFVRAHNAVRVPLGLHPYLPDPRTAWSAEDIVQDNARRGGMDHYAGGTSTPWTRMAARGVPGVAEDPDLGNECLAEGYPDEAGAVAGWLDEPAGQKNHRANVLSKTFTHIGGSVALTAGGRPIYAVDYVRLG
jgi:uncharacterized protein YkwD